MITSLITQQELIKNKIEAIPPQQIKIIDNTLSYFFISALFKETRAFLSFTPFLFSWFRLFIQVLC